MRYWYLGDLLRFRPDEGRRLVLRTFRSRGCSTEETARALGTSRQNFRRLVLRHGLDPELREAREHRRRMLARV